MTQEKVIAILQNSDISSAVYSCAEVEEAVRIALSVLRNSTLYTTYQDSTQLEFVCKQTALSRIQDCVKAYSKPDIHGHHTLSYYIMKEAEMVIRTLPVVKLAQ